jgi:hypothetical protein
MLWNRSLRYGVYNIPRFITALSQINPLHVFLFLEGGGRGYILTCSGMEVADRPEVFRSRWVVICVKSLQYLCDCYGIFVSVQAVGYFILKRHMCSIACLAETASG